MTRNSKLKLAVSLVLLAVAGIATVSLAVPAPRVFAGHYDWSDGGKDDLSVEFTPDGDDQWKVTFDFDFDGRDHTWKGTAQGGLEDGSQLTGTASWRNRKWTWTAAIEDGVMRGKHTELRSRGKTYETGTFELRR